MSSTGTWFIVGIDQLAAIVTGLNDWNAAKFEEPSDTYLEVHLSPNEGECSFRVHGTYRFLAENWIRGWINADDALSVSETDSGVRYRVIDQSDIPYWPYCEKPFVAVKELRLTYPPTGIWLWYPVEEYGRFKTREEAEERLAEHVA